MELIVLIVFVLIVWFVVSSIRKFFRRKSLMKKYGDMEVVKAIMAQTIWQGQTPLQLIDAIGKPLDIDQKVLKTKTKEIWKYNREGKNRYGLRVTLENDVVVGWDKK